MAIAYAYECYECIPRSADSPNKSGPEYDVVVVAAETIADMVSGLQTRLADQRPRVVLISAEHTAACKDLTGIYDVGAKHPTKSLAERFLDRQGAQAKGRAGQILLQDARSVETVDGLHKGITAVLRQAQTSQIAQMFMVLIHQTLVNEIKAEASSRIEVDPRIAELEQIYIGKSPLIHQVREQILKAARYSNQGVLILGESGTGKSRIAELIHRYSIRTHKPFVKQSCASIPTDLFESEMFGTVEGCYTGAKDKPGLFEQANGGTLFLDEVAEIAPEHQPKFLTVLREWEIKRVGHKGGAPLKVDVRVIFATHEDLKEKCQQKRFRSDLLYRVYNGAIIQTPALREHPEDIPLLAQQLWPKFWHKHHIQEIPPLPVEILREMEHCAWPGNIAQFETVLEQLATVDTPQRPTLRDFQRITAQLGIDARLVKHPRGKTTLVTDLQKDLSTLRGLPAMVNGSTIQQDTNKVQELAQSMLGQLGAVKGEASFRKQPGFLRKVRDLEADLEDALWSLAQGEVPAESEWVKNLKQHIDEVLAVLDEVSRISAESGVSTSQSQAIALTEDILQLREVLAKHAHDVWMEARGREGWKYGPKRNDDKKEHPDMISYHALSEPEKQYDRDMALGTLRALYVLGFDIVRRGAERGNI